MQCYVAGVMLIRGNVLLTHVHGYLKIWPMIVPFDIVFVTSRVMCEDLEVLTNNQRVMQPLQQCFEPLEVFEREICHWM